MTVRSLLFALLPASILLHSGIAGAWDDTVVTTFAGHQGDPAVAVSDSGTSVIVWYGSGEGDTLGIFGRRFAADGTPMGGEFRVNTVTVEEQDDCAVAMNGSGAFVVVWESDLQDGDEEGIYARRYDASGTPLDLVEIQVSTVSTDRQLDPNVAMADDGRFVVVWEAFPNFDGSAGAVYARLFGADGIPTTGTFWSTAPPSTVSATRWSRCGRTEDSPSPGRAPPRISKPRGASSRGSSTTPVRPPPPKST
jgi:hypothetical protein